MSIESSSACSSFVTSSINRRRSSSNNNNSGGSSSSSGSPWLTDSEQQFPFRLYRLLEEAKKKGFDDIISWSSSGNSFYITSKQRFENEVMPIYFTSNKYK
jgi:hypothetical protein